MGSRTESRRNVYKNYKTPEKGENLDLDLFPEQGEIWNSDSRFLGLVAGVHGGKTFMGPPWMWNEIGKFPQDDYMMVAPTYNMLDSNSLPAMLEWLELLGASYDIKEQKKKIILKSGARIYYRSSDKPQSMAGIHARAIWADEFGQMGKYAWEVMQRRVSGCEGRILGTTTPYAQNWLYYDFKKFADEGDPDYFMVQYESIKNPWFSKSEFERARRTLDIDSFDMYYRGLFRKRAGLCYDEFSEAMIVEPFKIPKSWRIIAGIDWGFNHPFVFTQWAISPKEEVYCCGEYYKTKEKSKEHAKKVGTMMGKRMHHIFYDPSEPQLATDFKNMLYANKCFNFSMQKADNARKAGVLFIKSLMQQNKFFAFNTCTHLIDEMSMYSWIRDTASGRLTDVPEKKNDDALDTGRYALFTGMKGFSIPLLVIGRMGAAI